MTEQTASAPPVEKWIIPFGVSFETLNKILKTYYIAGGDTRDVDLQNIIQRGVDRTPLVNNISFLDNLGALERQKQDPKKCKLTSLGLEYSKGASANDKEKTKTALKSMFNSSYKELVDYVSLNKDSLSFEDLFNHIKAMARIKEDEKYPPWKVNPAYRTGIFTMVDMLRAAGLVGDTIKPSEKAVSKAAPKPKQLRTTPRKTDQENRGEQIEPSSLQLGTQIQAQVIVDVKDNRSISNFLKMMQILKRINDGEAVNIDDEISVDEAGASGD